MDQATEYAAWRAAYEARRISEAVARTGVPPVAPRKPVDDIPEMQDVDALRSSGRLTEAHEQALAEADDLVKRADAYSDGYNILVGCVLKNE
jgi:hypothetical protein